MYQFLNQLPVRSGGPDMKELFLLATCLAVAYSAPHAPKAGVCGFDSCPKPVPGKINVHLVPHTHDDVGWGVTVDKYYYHSVQYILDSITDELQKDPTKRFIYVETAFFWKWWLQQTPEQQEKVKTLVNNGQLEFISGAWSMHDEGAVHYQSTIDQFTHGLRKLNDTFGYCGQPRVGWQIDTFGHGRETASLLAQFSFDGLFFARLDYNDKNQRLSDKTMETIWQGNPALGEKADIFTNVLYNHYSTPNGYCWDFGCSFNDQLVDDPDSPIYNLELKVNGFIDFCHQQAEHYTTSNIIVLFGDDFQYASSHNNFKNIDKLLSYVNARQANGSDINVFYSTPSCYLKAVNDANQEYTTKQDDFFPYASEPHAYWTGIFTSRPSQKYFERVGNRILQVGKQLASVTDVDPNEMEDIKGALGVLQHHDGISGTERQGVANDYNRALAKGITETEQLIASAINLIKKTKNPQAANLGLENCRFLNVSECALSAETTTFLSTVYNPLSIVRDYYVRLPVQNASYTVQDNKGALIATQLVPVPASVLNAPGRNATSTVELVFLAKDLPGLGFRTYYITKTGDTPQNYSKVWIPEAGQEVTIGDATRSLTLDGTTKFIRSVVSGSKPYDLTQTIQYYIGFPGNNSNSENRASGAYCFRPLGVSTYPTAETAQTMIVEGNVLTEIHQKFSDWATQVVRVYPGGKEVAEIEFLIGPIDISDDDGKEVVLRYESKLKSNGVFYTDNNGRGSMEHKRDYRATWDLQVDEPITGNYYPVNSHIAVKEGTTTLAVVNDRSQGGSSISDGVVELMVHRRLLYDDRNGVLEPLNETAFDKGLVIRGFHDIIIGTNESVIREKEVLRHFIPTVFLSDVTGRTQAQIANDYVLEYSSINANSLPPEINVLTLEPWREGQLLIRLENIFRAETGHTAASVDLTKLFVDLQVTGARETNLAAHKWQEEVQRLKWRKVGQQEVEEEEVEVQPKAVDLTNIVVNPEDIRTFVLDITRKA